jgi:hemerythrin
MNSSLMTLGVANLDHEHLLMTSLFSEYANCIRTNAPPTITHAALNRALAFGNEHIEHEESLMDQYAYPAADVHKRQHRNLRLQYVTFMSDTAALMAQDRTTLLHLDMMERLLVQHFNGPDQELAEYLTERGVH